MKETNKLTLAAAEIVNTKLGYRNENYGDDSTRLIRDIIDFEVNELGNNDIYETCDNLYGTKNIEKILNDKYSDINYIFGIWLSTREEILKHYSDEEQTKISQYNLPEDFLIISDLGTEGILIATQMQMSNFG